MRVSCVTKTGRKLGELSNHLILPHNTATDYRLAHIVYTVVTTLIKLTNNVSGKRDTWPLTYEFCKTLTGNLVKRLLGIDFPNLGKVKISTYLKLRIYDTHVHFRLIWQ